LNTAWSSSVTD